MVIFIFQKFYNFLPKEQLKDCLIISVLYLTKKNKKRRSSYSKFEGIIFYIKCFVKKFQRPRFFQVHRG